MTDLPLFSIITVCLNDVDGINKTMESVKRQHFRDFEWLVIDGKSCDGTVDVLNGCTFVDQMISEPDEGIYHAMNKGIKLAKGKYCLFLNAGDWFYSDSVLGEISKQLTADLVVGWINVIYPDKLKKRDKIKRLDLQDVREKYLYHRPLPHQATFIRRELFEKFGLYDQSFKLCADWDFFLRVINEKASLKFVKLCVSNYPFNGISSVSIGGQLKNNERMILRKRHFSMSYRLKRLVIDSIENLFNIRGF